MIKWFMLLSLLAPASGFAAALVGTTDRALKIDLFELRGIRSHTDNKLFLKARVQRGAKSFQVFCSRRALIRLQALTNILVCGEFAETVSNDDDESFEFEIVMINNEGGIGYAVQKIAYFGDGTILGDKAEILTGLKWSDRALEDTVIELKRGNNLPLAGFKQGEWIDEALRSLLDRKVRVRDGGLELNLPIDGFSVRIGDHLSATVSVTLNSSELERISVSNPDSFELNLLEEPGNLDSDLRTPAELGEEVRVKLGVQ